MVRTLPFNSETRPELSRILAIAAAIAVHAFAFLVLLIPMATPRPDLQTEVPSRPRLEPMVAKVVPEIPKPVDAMVVPKQPSRAQTPPTIVPDQTTPPSNAVIVENGTQPADPGPTAPTGDTAPDFGVPLSGVQLEYAVAKPPPYPREAVRGNLQGQVMLKILVGIDGKPLEVQVETSSGHRILDKAARDFVLKNWQFKPAMRNGQPVQAYGMVPINFSMQ